MTSKLLCRSLLSLLPAPFSTRRYYLSIVNPFPFTRCYWNRILNYCVCLNLFRKTQNRSLQPVCIKWNPALVVMCIIRSALQVRTVNQFIGPEFLFGQPEQSEAFKFPFPSQNPRTTDKEDTREDFPFSFNFWRIDDRCLKCWVSVFKAVCCLFSWLTTRLLGKGSWL